MKRLAVIALLALAPVPSAAQPSHADVALVGAGTYRPLFPATPAERSIAVHAFLMDRKPVTNGDFAAFVRAHGEWRRDRTARVFADASYLARWSSPEELGAEIDPRGPIVDVSWFAARAYCASRGMRLPTEAEWEHAADASRTSADGSSDPAWRTELMTLYSRPGSAHLPPVGSGAPNFWGISDLHGLVWEWVSDFDSHPGAMDCGVTSNGSTAITDFAAFQRAALRSSLHGDYTTHNLGFRCAMDASGGAIGGGRQPPSEEGKP